MATQPSIFGPSVAEFRAAQDRDRFNQAIQVGNVGNTSAFLGAATGLTAGNLFAQAIDQATGAVDPREAKLQKLEAVRQRVESGAITMEQVPDALMQVGLPDQAMLARQQIQELAIQTQTLRQKTAGATREELGIASDEANLARLQSETTPGELAQAAQVRREKADQASLRTAQAVVDLSRSREDQARARQQFKLDQQKTALEIARENRKEARAMDKVDRQSLEFSIKRADSYQGEVRKIKDSIGYEQMMANYQALESEIADISGTNSGNITDASIVQSFTKVVDPGSVTRESEVRAIQQTSGMAESLKSAMLKALDGGSLTPGQRREILRVARNRARIRNGLVQDAAKRHIAGLRREGLPNTEIAVASYLERLALVPVAGGDLPKGEAPAKLTREEGERLRKKIGSALGGAGSLISGAGAPLADPSAVIPGTEGLQEAVRPFLDPVFGAITRQPGRLR